MRLTVLGKSPSWQDAGGACSGYLIEEDDTVVLVDCGNGVFAKLRERVDYVDVDAVVISHLHADHFLDLVPYSYALTYAPRQQPVPVDRWPGTDCPACPVLHGPPGARDLFRRVVGSWGNEDLIEKAFELREYEASSEIEIGPIRVRFQPVPHFTETFAMSISSTNGPGRIVYGADSSPTEALEEFARDAELMLVEATLPRPERTGMRGHLTPRGGRRARAGGWCQAPVARAHLGRARLELGTRPGGRDVRRPGRGRPRGGRVRNLSAGRPARSPPASAQQLAQERPDGPTGVFLSRPATLVDEMGIRGRLDSRPDPIRAGCDVPALREPTRVIHALDRLQECLTQVRHAIPPSAASLITGDESGLECSCHRD